MKVTTRLPQIFFASALVLLFLRRVTCRLRKSPQDTRARRYREDGYLFFGSEELSPAPENEMGLLRQLLDAIEDSHQRGDHAAEQRLQSPDYNYVFMQEEPFYGERLGPRLRLTYGINAIEKWPALAQRIVNAEPYQRLLRELFGSTRGVHKCYIEKTAVGGREPWWHVDSVSQTNRLVFFLSDVTDADAPLEYLAGSQRETADTFAAVKRRHLLTAESWEPYERYKDLTPLRRFTGRPGESYLFDARGVHRASLSSGNNPRYVMMLSFTPATFSNWFLDLNRGGWPAGIR